MKRIIRRPVEAPLCACGCGQPVKWGRQQHKWRTYIFTHESRSEDGKRKRRKVLLKRIIVRPLQAPLCLCGCGKPVKRASTTRCNSHWNKYVWGHHARNEETRRKIGLKSIGRTHNRGRVATLQARINIGLSSKGRIWPEASKRACSERNKNERNPNWRGGVSKTPYSLEWSNALKRRVKYRDHWQCQNPHCKNPMRPFNVHHIDYDKMNCSIDNLITLCVRCNGVANGNREYWKQLYQGIICDKKNRTS